MTSNTEDAILERLIEPRQGGMNGPLAEYILTLDFKPQDHHRMRELSSKAQEGSLSDDDRQELDNYLGLSHFLALLQSKARLALKSTGSSL